MNLFVHMHSMNAVCMVGCQPPFWVPQHACHNFESLLCLQQTSGKASRLAVYSSLHLCMGGPAGILTPRGCRPAAATQEKQKASQHQIEELSEKVNALMLEKQQLERALERATSNNAQVRWPGASAVIGVRRLCPPFAHPARRISQRLTPCRGPCEGVLHYRRDACRPASGQLAVRGMHRAQLR